MNINDAKRIAEVITPEQFLRMFLNAKYDIRDWTARSNVNKTLSKGTAWNILSKVDPTSKIKLGVINAIREFGEYLPLELKPSRNVKDYGPIVHQEPNFDDFEIFEIDFI